MDIMKILPGALSILAFLCVFISMVTPIATTDVDGAKPVKLWDETPEGQDACGAVSGARAFGVMSAMVLPLVGGVALAAGLGKALPVPVPPVAVLGGHVAGAVFLLIYWAIDLNLYTGNPCDLEKSPSDMDFDIGPGPIFGIMAWIMQVVATGLSAKGAMAPADGGDEYNRMRGSPLNVC
eukprot:TRINITY_DN9_c0_g2_i7.p1 TRINITY_DN9_c0_g2~~TRINITY_DN9_c0_g2_i7.p1  ORF type:complete len:180 (+),score=38.43 TRINITY_DN9_c0_g2_i7:61-600(+)